MTITSSETGVRMVGSKPAHEQVAAALKSRIKQGVYPVRTLIPATAQLAREFGQPAEVIKRAIRELQTAGLVVRMPGHGTRVIWNGRAGGPETLIAQVQDLTRLVCDLTDKFDEETARLEQAFEAATEALQNEMTRLDGEISEIREAIGEALAALMEDG